MKKDEFTQTRPFYIESTSRRKRRRLCAAHGANKFWSFFLTTEGELPQSGKRGRPGACASEKTLYAERVSSLWRGTKRSAAPFKKKASPFGLAFFLSSLHHLDRVVHGEQERDDRQHPQPVVGDARNEQRHEDGRKAHGKHRVDELIIAVR